MTVSKADLRQEILKARSELSPFLIAQVNAELAEWMYRLPFELEPGDTVAAYVATRAEPGGTAILDALRDRGLRVIVPIVPDGPPAALDWGEYVGEESLAEGRWRLLEPRTGLGAPELARASVVLVPAVAVDRSGARLGRGAGYYDRTLAGTGAPVVAVVHDAELLDGGIPQEADDVPVGWALTPGTGYVRVGSGS